MDIEKWDHFLFWMELGRTIETTEQQKQVITPMENPGVKGIRISEDSGSGLGKLGSIKEKWGKGDSVWWDGGMVGEIKERIRLRRQETIVAGKINRESITNYVQTSRKWHTRRN